MSVPVGRGIRMVTKCFQCGNPTVKKFVVSENWWGDTFTLVENVPAWVCEHCGEQYFDAKVVKELDKMKGKHLQAKGVMQVPVYVYGQPA
jgi:YgiT-type zinc finger domain-containing protein